MKILLAMWLLFFLLTGTDPILLLNPSFEDLPAPGRGATGWYPCGLPAETPPDIHPSTSFGVFNEPYDGNSFAGLVVRDNGTYEALGQRLQTPLLAGGCYTFSLSLARSGSYSSFSRLTGFKADYNRPVVLRIWGGNKACGQAQLLAQSPPVEHEDWKKYSFALQPEADCLYFFMQAYYPDPKMKKGYLGNILLDDCSPIFPVDCQTEAWVGEVDKPTFSRPGNLAALRELLRQESGHIIFAPGTSALQTQYYQDEDGSICQRNLALHRLAYAITELPGSRLTLVVDGPDKESAEKTIYHLRAILTNLGLSHDQFEVRAWRRSDQKISWDAVNADEDLYFTVTR